MTLFNLKENVVKLVTAEKIVVKIDTLTLFLAIYFYLPNLAIFCSMSPSLAIGSECKVSGVGELEQWLQQMYFKSETSKSQPLL